MRRTPPIYANGRFGVLAPFDTIVNATVEYTVIAIRSFSDFAKDASLDISADIYVANGLTDIKFTEDFALGATIITLISSTGELVFIPDTYISSFPSLNVIGINRTVLMIDMRAIPDLLDLTPLTATLKAIVRNQTGIESDVKITKLPTPNTMTQDDYEAYEAARLGAITDARSDGEKVIYLEDALTRMKEQMAILTKVLQDHNII